MSQTKISIFNLDESVIGALTTPKIASIVYPGDDTAADTAGGQTITLNGSGFNVGAHVYIGDTIVSVVTVFNSSQLSFITPAKNAGSYELRVVNSDGGIALSFNNFQYSGVPEWTTPSGSLGSVFETQEFSANLLAVSDSAVSYELASGVLPPNVNLSGNIISGTTQLVSGSTTYNFSIDAIDQELQDTRRNFDITVNPDVVTWDSPANNTTYSNTVGDVFSLTLSASSVISNPITYTANVLPGGLSISGSNITGTFSTAANSSSLITATASNTNKFATRVLNWEIVSGFIPDQTFGWFTGGRAPMISTVNRIDYSNDLSSASVRGPLSANNYGAGATGNQSYGWFAGGGNLQFLPEGGFTFFTRVDRIDYNNDTVTAIVRGPLSLARRHLGATGNENFGWFGSGQGSNGPSAIDVSNVDRINYSNDTDTATARGPLSLARQHLAATGTSNFAWFGGGAPGPVSTVDRIDYNNDTSTAGVRGPLSLARSNLAATGNNNFGWFGGGLTPGLVLRSEVNRISYANDTSTATSRGSLSLARNGLSATGDINFGWFGGGGVFPTLHSRVDRITYSNDTVTAGIRGTLTESVTELSATGGFPG